MLFALFIFLFALAQASIVLMLAVSWASRTLRWMRRLGVGAWLLAPFRAWAGLDDQRGHKL